MPMTVMYIRCCPSLYTGGLAFSSACIYSKEFGDAGLGSALVLDYVSRAGNRMDTNSIVHTRSQSQNVNWRTLPQMRPVNNEKALGPYAHYQRRPTCPMRWFNPSLAHSTETPGSEKELQLVSPLGAAPTSPDPLSKLHSFPLKMHYTRAIDSRHPSLASDPYLASE